MFFAVLLTVSILCVGLSLVCGIKMKRDQRKKTHESTQNCTSLWSEKRFFSRIECIAALQSWHNDLVLQMRLNCLFGLAYFCTCIWTSLPKYTVNRNLFPRNFYRIFLSEPTWNVSEPPMFFKRKRANVPTSISRSDTKDFASSKWLIYTYNKLQITQSDC